MPFEPKPLAFDPSRLDGLSEKLLISHWENNYGGAVKRLNAIEQHLAELTWASAPVYEINGLKRDFGFMDAWAAEAAFNNIGA